MTKYEQFNKASTKQMIMSDDTDFWKQYIGRYCRVPIDNFSYFGWLKGVTAHELHFVAKDSKLKIIPRGNFEVSIIEDPEDREGNSISMPQTTP